MVVGDSVMGMMRRGSVSVDDDAGRVVVAVGVVWDVVREVLVEIGVGEVEGEIVKEMLALLEAELDLVPFVVLVTIVFGTHFPPTATTPVPVHSPLGQDMD